MMEVHKIRVQTEALEQQRFHQTSFIDFRYAAVKISINTTEGLFPVNLTNFPIS